MNSNCSAYASDRNQILVFSSHSVKNLREVMAPVAPLALLLDACSMLEIYVIYIERKSASKYVENFRDIHRTKNSCIIYQKFLV